MVRVFFSEYREEKEAAALGVEEERLHEQQVNRVVERKHFRFCFQNKAPGENFSIT